MDPVYTQLTQRIFKLLNEIPYNHRLIISISGSPGSGKNVTLTKIKNKINKLAHKRGFIEYNEELCVVIPQELFRIKRPDLEKLTENNKQLMMLRDVPKLYNSKHLLNLLTFLHQDLHELQTPTIYLPEGNEEYGQGQAQGKSRGTKISSSTRVIIIKGSYVQLKDPVWNEIAELVEERWFIRVKPHVAKRRNMLRYLRNSVVNTTDELEKMWQDVDSIKRDYVLTHTLMPDLIVDSIEDDSVKGL